MGAIPLPVWHYRDRWIVINTMGKICPKNGWGFQKAMEVPPAGWLMSWKIPSFEMDDDSGVPLFQETSILEDGCQSISSGFPMPMIRIPISRHGWKRTPVSSKRMFWPWHMLKSSWFLSTLPDFRSLHIDVPLLFFMICLASRIQKTGGTHSQEVHSLPWRFPYGGFLK